MQYAFNPGILGIYNLNFCLYIIDKKKINEITKKIFSETNTSNIIKNTNDHNTSFFKAFKTFTPFL